jgi:hypothetical protein
MLSTLLAPTIVHDAGKSGVPTWGSTTVMCESKPTFACAPYTLAQLLISTSNSDWTPTCDVGVTGATDIVQEVAVAVGVTVEVAVGVAVGVAVDVDVFAGGAVGVAVSVGVSVAAAWQVTEALDSAASGMMGLLEASIN